MKNPLRFAQVTDRESKSGSTKHSRSACFQKVESKNLIWAIPLPIGLAAYLWASSQPAISNHPEEARPSHQERVPRKDLSTADALTEQLGKFENERPKEAEISATKKRLASELSIAELKEKLLAMEATHDPFGNSDLDEFAHELGVKSGEAGVSWILENRPDLCPELYGACLDGWADADPGAAFGFVCESQRNNPCPPGTLMKLLQHHAGSVDSFREAAGKVPWELFRNWQYGEASGTTISGDVRMWIESGVARSLTEDGVKLRGLFRTWAQSDLPAAITGWSAWPDQGEATSREQLVEIVRSQKQNPNGTAALTASFKNLDPETTAKIWTWIEADIPNQSSYEEEALKTLRNIIPPEDPLTTEPGQ